MFIDILKFQRILNKIAWKKYKICMQASRRASQKKKERNSDRISVEEKNVYAEEKKHFFFWERFPNWKFIFYAKY